MRFLAPLLSFLTFTASLSIGALGCNSAKLTNASSDAGCAAPVLEYPCVLQPAGAPGCPEDVGSGAALGRDVVLSSTAPAPCTVIVYDLVPDEDNQCSQLGTCLCGVSDAGVYGWKCRE